MISQILDIEVHFIMIIHSKINLEGEDLINRTIIHPIPNDQVIKVQVCQNLVIL